MIHDSPDQYWDRKARREMHRRLAVAAATFALGLLLAFAAVALLGAPS